MLDKTEPISGNLITVTYGTVAACRTCPRWAKLAGHQRRSTCVNLCEVTHGGQGRVDAGAGNWSKGQPVDQRGCRTLMWGLMDRYSFGSWQTDFGSSPGESLLKDFDALIAIFDRELSRLPAEQSSVRSHIREARQAATRGRSLSEQLSHGLRKSAW